jgi:hypothetical protein
MVLPPSEEMKKPRQPMVSISDMQGMVAMICNLIMWSTLNKQCMTTILECLESREQQLIAIANTDTSQYPNREEVLTWIAALCFSVQATVKYASKKICFESKKIKWDACDSLIVKEPILLELIYLGHAVAGTFSTSFSSYIDMKSKIKDCGGIGVLRFVTMFKKYLRHSTPGIPIHKPLRKMFHINDITKVGQSKICIGSFLVAHTKPKLKEMNSNRQQCNIDTDMKQIHNYICSQLSQMLKLEELHTLSLALRKAQKKQLSSKQVQSLDDRAKLALESLWTNEIEESKLHFYSTCLAVFTMFAYELLKGPKIGDNKKIGRKILLKFLEAAFKGASSKSNGDEGAISVRECTKNALQMLIEGNPPLFTHLFVAAVVQEGFEPAETITTTMSPPFSIPADSIWKCHFPIIFNEVTTSTSLKKKKKSKDCLDSATGVLVKKGGISMTKALASAIKVECKTSKNEIDKKPGSEAAKEVTFSIDMDNLHKEDGWNQCQQNVVHRSRSKAKQLVGHSIKKDPNEAKSRKEKEGTDTIVGRPAPAGQKRKEEQISLGKLTLVHNTSDEKAPSKSQVGMEGERKKRQHTNSTRARGEKIVQKQKLRAATKNQGLGKKIPPEADLRTLVNKVPREKGKVVAVEVKEEKRRDRRRQQNGGKNKNAQNFGDVPAKNKKRKRTYSEKNTAATTPAIEKVDVRVPRRSPRKKSRA